MSRALAPPGPRDWDERARWFWAAHDANAGPAPLDLDPRREALLADLEVAFCAGAWSAVVLLAWALAEQAARVAEGGGQAHAPAADLDWLRERRNAWAHGVAAGGSPAAAAGARGEASRDEAEGAVRVAFRNLFAEAWR